MSKAALISDIRRNFGRAIEVYDTKPPQRAPYPNLVVEQTSQDRSRTFADPSGKTKTELQLRYRTKNATNASAEVQKIVAFLNGRKTADYERCLVVTVYDEVDFPVDGSDTSVVSRIIVASVWSV